MSSHSTKTAGRSSKAARRARQKRRQKRPRRDQEGVEIGPPSGRQGHAAGRHGDPRAQHCAQIRGQVGAKPKMIRTPSPPVQPLAAPEIVIRAHKYQVGETVYFTSPTFGRAAATGSYTVVKLLPSEGDDYQYRIKSSGEAFERVAKESQLDRI